MREVSHSAVGDAVDDPALRDEAQHWVLRLVAKDVSEAEIDALEAWLASDPRHARAFSRERSLWQDLNAFAGVLAGPPVSPSNLRPLLRRRLARFVPLAMAASVAAFLLGPSLITGLRADYRTGAGEIRTIALSDGTTVMLDAASAIAVDYESDRRTVQLLAGRAWFDVRHESRRFVVVAMGGTTRDIGTGFEVRRGEDAVEVGVTEGSVEVTAPNGALGPPLRAGERMRYSTSGLDRLASMPASDLAPWRNRELLFDRRPMDAAIAEIARYRQAPVWTFGDFSRAAPVSGLFLIDRPDEALQTLARMRGLRVTTLPGGVLILRPAATP